MAHRTRCVSPRIGTTGTTVGALIMPVAAAAQSSDGGASAEQRFEFLHGNLHQLSEMYVQDVYRTIGFLLLVIGWVVTSKNTRSYLRAHARVRATALTGLGLATALHMWLELDRYRVSLETWELLNTTAFFPSVYYAHDRITAVAFIGNLAIQLLLIGILFVVTDAAKHNEA